jgi:hypothetical protein
MGQARGRGEGGGTTEAAHMRQGGGRYSSNLSTFSNLLVKLALRKPIVHKVLLQVQRLSFLY